MRTPIVDFVKEYAEKQGSRFHMPGHKGGAFLGCERLDITEIAGADALYEADGIIAESEQNAAVLFQTARTVFSTEGSSQCIRAMMKLAVGYWKEETRPYVIAARNVHKAFLYAAALVDFDVVWLYPKNMHSLCSCEILAEQAEAELCHQMQQKGVAPAAVYVTSPDYLGSQLEIAALAEVCHRYGTILAVDNAHGAYLHFLEEKQHPIDLGADICCDSAHKTLPVLTGGAYLQISKHAPDYFAEHAKEAMALFGSTSPSYLMMASLDLCNAYLASCYKERLEEVRQKLEKVRMRLREVGWRVEKTDPLKLTIQTLPYLSGIELADRLRKVCIECEYADENNIVFMITPENTEADFEKLVQAMEYVIRCQRRYGKGKCVQKLESAKSGETESQQVQLQPVCCEQKMSIREAIFANQEQIQVSQAVGRVCGVPTVGCPPAIPIAAAGEIINEEAVKLFEYYGIETVSVIK